MALAVLPTAADELPNAVLLKLPIPASCLFPVSNGFEPENDTDKPADVPGKEPNLKREVVENEVATTGVEEEEQLLLDAVSAGVVMLIPVGAEVALMPPLAERDELLLLKLFDT